MQDKIKDNIGTFDKTDMTQPMGTESRLNILPKGDPDDYGFILPPYDFAGNLPGPPQIGVKRGGDIGDVLNAARGVIYYTDQIGFGESTNPFTRGMDLFPMGINYFLKTGLECTNGATMWKYIEAIPKGDSLGKGIQSVIKEMGLPQLRGLAPGMLEDAKGALNPMPLLQATIGSAYPKCKKVTLPVGDIKGQTKDPKTGDEWIRGPIEFINGKPHQTHWVQETDAKGNPVYVTQEQFFKACKTKNPNGTEKGDPKTGCVNEGFENVNRASLAVAIVLGALAVWIRTSR